jgi:FkbM family methyltransferase
VPVYSKGPCQDIFGFAGLGPARSPTLGSDLVRAHSTRFGFDFLHRSGDRFVGEQIALNRYEPYESLLFVHLVREGQFVVDVGANLGWYTLLASAAVGEQGRVLALEPHPAHVAVLSANIALHEIDNVEILAAAAGREAGEVMLFENDENLGDHRVWGYAPGERHRPHGMVPVVRLDTLPDMDAVDLVKIDVQGYDFPVLQGLERRLASRRPLTLLTEFWEWGSVAAGSDPRAHYTARSVTSAGVMTVGCTPTCWERTTPPSWPTCLGASASSDFRFASPGPSLDWALGERPTKESP